MRKPAFFKTDTCEIDMYMQNYLQSVDCLLGGYHNKELADMK